VRLQLIAVVVVAAAAFPARALAQRAPWEGAVTTKASVYADDDDTLIGTGLAQGELGLPLGASIGGHVLVDSISSASVDVISAATPGFEETRIELGGQARLRRSIGEAGVAYVRSTENDWSSHAVQLTLARDLAEKNTRLELAYGYTSNVVGRAGDDAFERPLVAHTVEAGLTQLLDRRTLVGVTYTLQASDGFQSSPYRYVWLRSGVAFLETHPAQRTRHAVTLRALRYLGGAGLDVSYRLYLDDWGVVSHTGSAAVTFALGEAWDLRLRGRFYRQGPADFWRERYDTPMTYMSADRELATSWNAGGGVKLAWHRGRWTVDAKADATLYRFVDFARLDGRSAIVVELGGGLAW
jgi:hypothetical protein